MGISRVVIGLNGLRKRYPGKFCSRRHLDSVKLFGKPDKLRLIRFSDFQSHFARLSRRSCGFYGQLNKWCLLNHLYVSSLFYNLSSGVWD